MSAVKSKTGARDARVEILIPRGGEREDPNLFVGINGVNYLLPKGRRSLVPPAVAEEIDRAERAREARDRNVDKLLRSLV